MSLTLTEACIEQAEAELDNGDYDDYINNMTNWELIQFLERVETNHGQDLK